MAAKVLSILTLLQVAFVCIKADDLVLRSNNYNASEFNVSSSLEDYINQNDRQYSAQLADYVSQLANFRADYHRQLEIINHNRDLVEAQIVEVDQKLYPLELLNDLSKYCVQKYSSLLVTTTTVRSAYEICVNQANMALSSILIMLDNINTTLNFYYNSNWKNGITDCARQNPDSYKNHTLCVVQLVAFTNTFFNNDQLTFTKHLDESRCLADTRIRQAVECVFTPTNNALSSIGEVSRLVHDCIAGIGHCEACPQQSKNATIIHDSDCQDRLVMDWNSQYISNATISNPFIGLNDNIRCVFVSFSESHVS